MTDRTQSEAGSTHIIRYALELGLLWIDGDGRDKVREALDALDILEAQLASIGAGGVQALSAAPAVDIATVGEAQAFEAWYKQDCVIEGAAAKMAAKAAWKARAMLAASPTPPAEKPIGELVVTKTKDGQIVAVTRQDDEGRILSVIATSDPAEQQARWVERWHGSGGKEFWEGWSILNAANREMIAHLGPYVDPDAVRGIVAAHNEALCGECAGTGGRWCPACAGATPPAEQQAQPGAVYAELPQPDSWFHFTAQFWENKLRDFADRTHALRIEQAAPKAAPGESEDSDGFGSAEHWKEKAQYWAGVAHRLRGEALRGEPVDGIVHPPAPQQEAQEPVAWQGVHDQTDLYYTKPLQADVRPLYAAPQPAPAELERLRERIARMGLDVDRAMRGHVNEQSPLGTTRLAAIAALAKPAPAPLRDDVVKDALSAAPAIGDELRDTIVAVSAAIAEGDDRAAQKMICEILAASTTPPAEQQAQPGAVYAELPRAGAIGYASVVDVDRYAIHMAIGPHLPGVRDIALWTTDQLRDFADRTHALRIEQAAPKAAPGESEDSDGFGSAEHWKEKAQYWAGVAHRLRGEALRGEPVDGIVHPPAPQQEAQEPVAWQGVHDQTDLYYTKPLQADVRPLYAAPQPAPAPLSDDTKRLDWLNRNIFCREMSEWDAKYGHGPDYNMWVVFSPKGVQGSARNIIDAAIAAQRENK